jgi:hypothetical protein
MKEEGVTMPGIKSERMRSLKLIRKEPNLFSNSRKYGYDKWKRLNRYGRRWAAESVISAIKRIFGETVRANSIEGMFCEVRRMLTFCTINLNI